MKNMNYLWGGELHGRAGRQAALQDWLVGCTLNWAVEKGGPEGCPFPQPADSSRFSFGNTARRPSN